MFSILFLILFLAETQTVLFVQFSVQSLCDTLDIVNK